MGGIINVETVLKNAKASMSDAKVTKSARNQLILYSLLYIVGVVVVAVVVSVVLDKILVLIIHKHLFFLFIGILLAAWAGITFLYYGHFEVEPNEVWFVRVMKGAYRPISQGRTNYFPPIQDIHPQYVSLQRQNIDVEEELELREVLDGDEVASKVNDIVKRKIHPHEKTTVTAKVQVEYQIFDPYLFAFVMGGNTKEAKQKTISGLIQDPLQTFVNGQGFGEDELVALTGFEVWKGIGILEAATSGKKLKEAVEEYGFKILRITIQGTELDEERKKARTETYKGRLKGQARALEMDEIVKGAFGKNLKAMKEDKEALREARAYFITLLATDALKSGDKYVIGVKAVIDEINAMLKR